MGFMSAYKHLDTICRDMNGIGVSGYIEDMEANRQGSYEVHGWDSDYRQLKHYRWVRNQIAHEVNAEEENMCVPEDTQWLEDFYQRIMNRSDPLARYTSIRSTASVKRTAPCPAQYKYMPVQETKQPEENHFHRYSGWLIFALLAVVTLVVWCITIGI